MTNYLSATKIIAINARIIQREGESNQKPFVRDPEALKFLAQQPEQETFNEKLYPTLQSKAGILLVKLVKKHVFEDANKRTAALCFLIILKENNYTFTANWKELADYILEIARIDDSNLNYEKIYDWIEHRITPKKA